MRKQTLPRQSADIVDLITILWENVSKISEKKKRKLVLLVLHLTKIQIGGSKDHLIAKFPKPPKDSEKICKSDKSKEKGNSAKDNRDDDDDLKVYTSMA